MDIKGCPWCGMIPNEVKTNHGAHYLECDNYACPVQPMSQVFSSREKLIRKWNERIYDDYMVAKHGEEAKSENVSD